MIRGGGTFPSKTMGRVNATWPLAYLQADDQVVQIDTTLPWLKPAFISPVTEVAGRPTWACQWSELDRVVTAERSAVFLPKAGRGCRFVTLSQERLQPLLTLIKNQRIERVNARTTIDYTMRI
jgi:hypothetical protein